VATPEMSVKAIGQPDAIAVQGDYAFLGAGPWLYIVNIHDKGAPNKTSRLWIANDTVKDIAVYGTYAFVAMNQGGLNIINIGIPANPTWVGVAPVSSGVIGVAISGHYAFLACNQFFYILDINDPANPVTIFKKDLGIPDAAHQITLYGRYAYLAGSQGVYIYDVTNPAIPGGPWHFATGTAVKDIVLDDYYAYLADDHGLRILEISNLSDLRVVSNQDLSAAYGITKAGSFIYVADGTGGLYIYDISNATGPQLRYHYNPGAFIASVSLQDNFILLAEKTPDQLRILDVADATAPIEKGSYTPGP
jgi:hypothetical protein